MYWRHTPSVTVFVDTTLIKVIKVKWSRKGRVLSNRTGGPLISLHVHTQRKDHVRTQREGGRLQVRKWGPLGLGSSGSLITSSIQNCEKINFYFTHSPSGLRHSWALPSDGSILKLFTPICLGFIFLPLFPPPTPHPKQTQNRASSSHCLFPTLTSCCLRFLLLREAAYLNGKGGMTKMNQLDYIFYLKLHLCISLLLESRRQAIDFPPPAVTTFPRGDNFFWLAAQMRTRSQGDRRN